MQSFYAQLYWHEYSRLITYLQKVGIDKCDAEDILQTVFLRLLERGEQRKNIRNWKAYLFILVRNEAVNHRRNLQRQRELRNWLAAKDEQILSRIETRQERTMLLLQVSQLPLQQQRVYELRFGHGWRYKHIATILNITPATVRTHARILQRRLLRYHHHHHQSADKLRRAEN